MAPVVFDPAGNLYGTTYLGGKNYGHGTVFELSPPSVQGGSWTEIVLHSFRPSSDGDFPLAGLALGPGRVLFGTASAGGTNQHGTAFALKPPPISGGTWGFAVLQSFNVTDGDGPMGGLILGGPSTLYGTAGGGVHDAGVVFQLSYSGGRWIETVLYNFGGGSTGVGPTGVGLYNDALYGTTAEGGYKNVGVVYRLSR